jgi:hypothetical protein
MNASGRQVYLTALAMASKRVSTSFGVSRENWKTESLLGRNAFDRGVKECAANGLLIYRRYVLTLNATSRPKERIEHENPRWKFDLNSVTVEQWQKVCEALLKRTFIVGDSGWSHATRESLCPFCTEPRSFRLNFKDSKYLCNNDKCGRFGRMGQLVQRVLRVTQMSEAKKFIQAVRWCVVHAEKTMPKRTTSKLKKLIGTDRSDRIKPTIAAQPIDAKPAAGLDSIGSAEYQRITALYAASGRLTALDQTILSLYASCFRQLDLAPFDLLFWPHPLVIHHSVPGRSGALRRP